MYLIYLWFKPILQTTESIKHQHPKQRRIFFLVLGCRAVACTSNLPARPTMITPVSVDFFSLVLLLFLQMYIQLFWNDALWFFIYAWSSDWKVSAALSNWMYATCQYLIYWLSKENECLIIFLTNSWNHFLSSYFELLFSMQIDAKGAWSHSCTGFSDFLKCSANNFRESPNLFGMDWWPDSWSALTALDAYVAYKKSC